MKFLKLMIVSSCLIVAQSVMATAPTETVILAASTLKDQATQAVKSQSFKQTSALRSAARTTRAGAILFLTITYTDKVLNGSQDFTDLPDMSLKDIQVYGQKWKTSLQKTCASLNLCERTSQAVEEIQSSASSLQKTIGETIEQAKAAANSLQQIAETREIETAQPEVSSIIEALNENATFPEDQVLAVQESTDPETPKAI